MSGRFVLTPRAQTDLDPSKESVWMRSSRYSSEKQLRSAKEIRRIFDDVFGSEVRSQRSLLPLAGSGSGLYGRDSTANLRELRDEWDR